MLGRYAEMSEEKMDKTAFSVVDLREADDDDYWLSRTPLERLEAVEFMRRVMFGDDQVSSRLSRVLEITELKKR